MNPHEFILTGRAEMGKSWVVTINETSCRHCGLTYWVGQEPRPDGDCDVLLKQLRKAVHPLAGATEKSEMAKRRTGHSNNEITWS